MAENKQEPDFNVSDAINKTEHFVDQNKKSLGIILIALFVAIGGYMFYQKIYVAGKEKDAAPLLYHAEKYFNADSLNLAINGDGNNPGLEELVSDYSVSPSGNIARYYLGMAYIKKKEYEKAIETLKSYTAEDQITGSVVYGAIGDAYMELKNSDDAINYYEMASKENSNTFTTPMMMMKWAGALESKSDYSGAKKVYEKLKKDYSASTEAAQVDKYIARVDALAGSN